MTDADSEENDSIPFEIPAKRLHLHRMHMKNWVVSLDSTKYKVFVYAWLYNNYMAAISYSF